MTKLDALDIVVPTHTHPAEPISAPHADQARCPADHSQYKTPRISEPGKPAIEQDADGIWQVHGFDEAKQILRNADTTQMGFNAEFLDRTPSNMRRPILYLEGPEHLEQRKQTARFFTPKAVEGYRPIMEMVAKQEVAALQHSGRADLRKLSLGMAMRVVAEVVGLTSSIVPGIEKRLDAFLKDDEQKGGSQLGGRIRLLYNRLNILTFFYLDVKPAINARKRQPQDDLVSYLIGQGYKDWEIFTECVTYGAAGMVTTREFMALALWHLMEKPELRARYLQASEEERRAILHEILRLEPIVTQLKRKAAQDMTIESNGRPVTIRKGELIHLFVQDVNTDESVVGEGSLALCPMRDMHKQVVMPSVMSFGDGHHRCPGAYVSLQETDVLLQHLLPLDGLRIVQEPRVGWSKTASGPVLSDFIVALDR